MHACMNIICADVLLYLFPFFVTKPLGEGQYC